MSSPVVISAMWKNNAGYEDIGGFVTLLRVIKEVSFKGKLKRDMKEVEL